MPQYVFRVPENSDEQAKLDSLLSGLCDFFQLITYQAIVVVTDEHDRKVSAVLSEMTDIQIQSKPKSKPGHGQLNHSQPDAPAFNSTKYNRRLSTQPVAERPCIICGKPTTKPSGCCSKRCYQLAYSRKLRAERSGPDGLETLEEAPGHPPNSEALDSGEN